MTNMRLFFHVLHSVHSAVLAEAMTTLQLTSTATAFFVPLLAEEVANFMFPSYFHANRQRQFRILQLEAPCSPPGSISVAHFSHGWMIHCHGHNNRASMKTLENKQANIII